MHLNTKPHFDATDDAILFFLENDTGYGFLCELLNSDKSLDEIAAAAEAFFPTQFSIVTGNHVSSKFFQHLLTDAVKNIDWYTVIRTCVQMQEGQ